VPIAVLAREVGGKRGQIGQGELWEAAPRG
jgi:hypothetical protein